MKTTWIPPIISKILGIKNAAGTTINPATEEKQDMIIALNDMTVLLKAILISIQMPRNADPTNNADQVVIIGTVPISGSVTATVASTTVSAFNGEQAHQMSVASEINAWANVQRSTIS